VRSLGVRPRQRHGHVHVRGPGSKRTVEDRHDEARVDGVEDVRAAVLADERLHGGGIGGVDARGREPWIARVSGDRALGPGRVVVRDDHGLEELAPGRDGHDRTADAAGADHQDSQ
jgi:hypothetical protein